MKSFRAYIKKEFIEKLISNIKKINIENPENKESDLVPQINSNAFKNFKKYVKIATEK